jgi:hypothetical protein
VASAVWPHFETTSTIASQTPNPSVVGQSVTVAFTLVQADTTITKPTGNVRVNDGAEDSCTGTDVQKFADHVYWSISQSVSH